MTNTMEAGYGSTGFSEPMVPSSLSKTFSITFSLETLRIIAFSAFAIMMIIGTLLTKLVVEKDPNYDPEATVIYQIFGFNHSCNLVDHNPSRMISAILSIFFIIPLDLFHILSYFRIKYEYLVKNEIPESVYTFAKVTTPFNFFASTYIFMWFVNNPEDDYGFIAHYIPYLTFQLMIALMTIQQVYYYTMKDRLPYGITPRMARMYMYLLIGLTAFSLLFVVTLLAGHPIMDTVNNPAMRSIVTAISSTYSLLFVFGPIFFSIEHRKLAIKENDLETITFAS